MTGTPGDPRAVADRGQVAERFDLAFEDSAMHLALQEPFRVGGTTLRVTASVGLARGLAGAVNHLVLDRALDQARDWRH